MRLNLILALMVLGLLCSCQSDKSKSELGKQLLTKNWEFREVKGAEWLEAEVPGCVHTDLLMHKLIEDPFYRLNEKDQQWIGETDWEYKTTFNLSKAHNKKEQLFLVFEGLDTYTDVYLNDSLILSSDNMFRTWRVDVKDIVKEANNEIRVYFHNVFKINSPKYQLASFRLQAFDNNDQAEEKLNLYSRKAGYHYGWDWGPRLITSGIWKDVYLQGWDDVKLNNVQYILEELNEKSARYTAVFEIESTVETKIQLCVEVDQQRIEQEIQSSEAGIAHYSVEFEIKNPKLWWSNGLGEAHLYGITAMIESERGNKDAKSEYIGVRSIEVIREDDQFGKSMYIKLNGHPVFMKGANYIPQDNFTNRIEHADYEYIIEAAKAANMNMLRVWGGGIYQGDTFYDLCDKNGILVWQDFMFACGMYPADEEFLENVKHEVIDNVKRIRNHASLALYCGNNENEISWYDWGWKEMYDEDTQKIYEEDLRKLFRSFIPGVLGEVDPTRYYHPSSPVTGYNDIHQSNGDSHYWGVWHGKEPFVNFEDNVSRFNSEYGFQSYPEFNSIKRFSIEEDWFLESDVMHAHQRCMSDARKDKDYGNRLINTYLERNFRIPKDFEHYVYTTQVLQAKGVVMAVEAHRRKMADQYSMGTLYWQINDCWPVASWSSIDYYGKWKALHYRVREAYKTYLIAPYINGEKIEVYLVSDNLEVNESCTMTLELLNFKGEILWTDERKVDIAANTSELAWQDDTNSILDDQDRSEVYFNFRLSHSDQLLAENKLFLLNEREIDFPNVNIDFEISSTQEGILLELNSDKLARYVYLSVNDEKTSFSDNYFDLDAAQAKSIQITSNLTLEELKDKLKIISLVDSYN